MGGVERIDGGPKSVIVVGAGIVGLSTAWFLQERGVDVTVVDRSGIAAGASWANAGWLAPGLAFPAANCRQSSWERALRANVALNEECLEASDVLVANGVDAPVTDAPITAAFRSGEDAQRMLGRLRQLENAGQTLYVTALTGEALREQVPLASAAVTAGLSINAQRFVEPRRFVEALGRSVLQRGATMHRLEIREVLNSAGGVAVYPHRGRRLTADAVVIATGARLSGLIRRWLRVPLQVGRGYSFTVPVDRPIPGPIYLPDVRVACTPYRGALRVSGGLEFGHPNGPRALQRANDIAAAASPLLDGARWDVRANLWVGACAATLDGRPLIGELASGIYVAGAHGMWGLAHGPVTGRLLAEQITTGKQPQALAEFDPMRRKPARHGPPSRQGRLPIRPSLTTPILTAKGRLRR
ncbi:amino acid dehydrogenase [Mycobacterium alsense]|uniref:Amino acid dehydrogenase n=1 Tax=Mycobacterium alsense TaxID=324058 RepID=A0ABD6P4Z7_9MYCO|nr:FAD-dependent oxidoreductase [Mycobacterium alsense]OBG39796.1 amino acid dehydrogenase [Mycobacterium alsense]OBI95441.1 amino acid dehydrogenase [Mycobacterium alsense]